MRRLGLILLCIAILVLFLARGDQSPDEDLDQPIEIDTGPAPLPALPPEDLVAKAQGIYIVETPNSIFTLELHPDRKFVFRSRANKQEPRVAKGTWSLTGSRLSLAYYSINDKPIERAPVVAVETWLGKTIELRNIKPKPRTAVVLTKRGVLRTK